MGCSTVVVTNEMTPRTAHHVRNVVMAVVRYAVWEARRVQFIGQRKKRPQNHTPGVAAQRSWILKQILKSADHSICARVWKPGFCKLWGNCIRLVQSQPGDQHASPVQTIEGIHREKLEVDVLELKQRVAHARKRGRIWLAKPPSTWNPRRLSYRPGWSGLRT